jgi:hypothetical protein
MYNFIQGLKSLSIHDNNTSEFVGSTQKVLHLMFDS